jgi:uncharacterized DUF497 family protein
MRFTWDEAKRQANLAKHGLDFAEAHRVFEGLVIRYEDERFHYYEQRMVAMGLLDTAVVLVVHVERGNLIRVISMRKADKHETNLYFKALGTF